MSSNNSMPVSVILIVIAFMVGYMIAGVWGGLICTYVFMRIVVEAGKRLKARR